MPRCGTIHAIQVVEISIMLLRTQKQGLHMKHVRSLSSDTCSDFKGEESRMPFPCGQSVRVARDAINRTDEREVLHSRLSGSH